MKFVQSFKDRFLSRGGGRIESFVLSAYGKLPIYKDYIMWECHAGAAAEMKRWLDEAFGMTWEEFGGKGIVPAGPARALLLLPGGKWAVAAALRPSTDEGGLRKFPFTLFACFGRGELVGRGVRGAVEALTPVWESLEDQQRRLAAIDNIEDLYSYLQRTAPAPADPCPEADGAAGEGTLDVAAWMQAIGPDNPAGLRRWFEEKIRETLAAYRGFPEQGESLAARLPLAPGLSAALQADLWAQAFQGNLKKCPAFPSLVIERPEAEGAAPAVSLVWRELKREDAWLFSGRTGEYEFVENLCPPAPPDLPAGDDGDAPADPVQWLESLGQ
ncbi:MAG: TagF domain-containing protein [bacterium]|nr:TagF domain-containing protein [bacterium]